MIAARDAIAWELERAELRREVRRRWRRAVQRVRAAGPDAELLLGLDRARCLVASGDYAGADMALSFVHLRADRIGAGR